MLLRVLLAASVATPTRVDVAVDDTRVRQRRAELLLQLDRRLVRIAVLVGEEVWARESCERMIDEGPERCRNRKPPLLVCLRRVRP